MANELPEVVPEVRSMPTTGWFCQTSGNARRRITKNTGSSENGIYDVAGIPGHSHNASAVISVDADYSRYRQTALSVPGKVWSYAALNMPVGLLTDSIEPTHASERYDRCIERCVGYMSIFPENCAGSIREPTRSIGEIRTLVAPKARLDTLTYVQERRGWVVPVDETDGLQDRALLVSDFPDVYLDVRPLGMVMPATVDADQVPSSLYIEAPTFALRVQSDGDGLGIIGRLADGGTYTAATKYHKQAVVARTLLGPGAPGIPGADALVASTAAELALADAASAWDGTFRFVWNEDERKYQMPAPVSVVLNHVVRSTVVGGERVEQVPTYDWEPNNSDEADGTTTLRGVTQAARITVQFPALSTTEALDGSCWFGAFANEESLNYATRTAGLVLCRKTPVDVIGAQGYAGPFTWIGMPAYRIPVGSAYAHPAPDILQENRQFNHWDKFGAFVKGTGFLKYQYMQQKAAVDAGAAGDAVDAQQVIVDDAEDALEIAEQGGNPETIAEAQDELEAAEDLQYVYVATFAASQANLGPDVFELNNRERAENGGIFYRRAGGILGQLTKTHYPEQPNFDEDPEYPYYEAYDGDGGNQPAAGEIITDGLQNTLYSKSIGQLDPDVLYPIVQQAALDIQQAQNDIAFAINDQNANESNEFQPGDQAAYAVATVELQVAEAALATAEAAHTVADANFQAAIVPFTRARPPSPADPISAEKAPSTSTWALPNSRQRACSRSNLRATGSCSCRARRCSTKEIGATLTTTSAATQSSSARRAVPQTTT